MVRCTNAPRVAQRGVVELGGGDALGDGLGELGGDLVHVGQAVGECHRELAFARAFGHARADRFGQRELAPEVVGLDGADAEVGADGGDPVGLAQSGASGPAVGELRLLVGQGEVLALVLLGLDPADLVAAGLVVEQRDDQAADGGEPIVGQRVAAAGGQQPSLAGVEHDAVVLGAVADAGHELAGAHQHLCEAFDPVGVDLAAGVGRELEV